MSSHPDLSRAVILYLDEWRKQRRLSLRELAELLTATSGMRWTRANLDSMIRRPTSRIDLDSAKAIAMTLDTSIDGLLKVATATETPKPLPEMIEVKALTAALGVERVRALIQVLS